MKRVAIYVRVSTQEQKKYGFSVANQIDSLKKYCEEKSYLVVDVYNDAGISARKTYKKRPELMRLLDDCTKGKIDLIIFTKLDRWFRSVADYYETQNILDKKNVKWRAIWEDYDTETSAGVFKVNIMLSVAQAEADRTSERIKAVNEYRREVKNEYVYGKAATGYKVVQSQLLIDEDAKEGVAAFFDEYLTNYNLTHAVQVLRNYGVNVRRDTARRMLNNKVYYGDAYGYKCVPYITQEQFDKIQSHLSGMKQRENKYGERIYLFNGGLIRCAECKAGLIATIRNIPCGQKKKLYKYYRCTNHRNMACSMSRSRSEISIEKELLDRIDKELAEYNVRIKENKTVVVDNSKAIQQLESRLERLAELYEIGDISKEKYFDKKRKIITEISELKIDPILETPKSLPDNWKEVYTNLSDINKRAFWYNTLSAIYLDQNGNITIQFN